MNLTVVFNVCETWPVILKEGKKLTHSQLSFWILWLCSSLQFNVYRGSLREKSDLGVKLCIHFQQNPRIKMSGAIQLLLV